jgi:hypothetical protein
MDFTTSLILDSRLMVSDKINYGVVKGGETITHQRQSAVSNSNSSLVFNVQVPSLQTVIDRRVLFGMDFILKIVGSPATGTRLLNLGQTDALAYFPLHQMMATMTTTINSSSISSNIPDILPALIKLHDKRSLQKYNSLTPTMTDNYFDYANASATGANNNPLLTYSTASYDNSFQPNGAFRPIGFGTDAKASNGVVPQAGDGTEKTYYVKYRCVEPLLFLSPFTYSTESNSQGLYGVQNMNFQFQFGNIQRVWRSSAGFDKTITLQEVVSANLDFIFINSHPSLLMSSKNVVPYIEYPRYISPLGGKFTATSATGARNAVSFSSQSLSLNVVPDKLVVYLRSRADFNSKRCVPDRFLSIENIALNFNNSSGILSTAQPSALFQISAENGLAVSFQEFEGVASGLPLTNGLPANVALCGAPVVLCMGKDIQLVQDYIASGAIGNFNLQITGSAVNQGSVDLEDVELVIIAVNSGILVVEQGVSSVYTGILTKEDILKASDQGTEGYNVTGWNQYVRMTGAGLLDQIKTIGVRGLKMAQPLIEGSKLGELAKKVTGGRKMGANRLM